jgi:hypothetical protein
MPPSSREPDSEDFVRRYWTALVKLRNRERTESAEGRHLLRQLPPRLMRYECLHLVRAKQKDPEGQYSPRAPMTASALFAPRAGASSGFHRYTNCKFPAPVLRACSSAHHIQEPEDVVAAAVRLVPVQPLPLEAAPISALEFCGPQRYGGPLRFPGCIFQCVRSNAPNSELTSGHTAQFGRNSISFNCTLEKSGLGTTRGIRMIHIPERG